MMRRMNMRSLSPWARHIPVALAAVLIDAAAGAQDGRMFDERGSVLFGVFVTEPNTSARLDSASGIGTDIDLENDLGLDTSKTVARLSGYFWLSERHRLDFSAFQYSREASRVIDKTIDFGDETFEIDTVVSTTSDVTVFKAAYTFAPVVRRRGDFGITAGLYTAQVDLGLADRQSETDESEGLTAPLPVLGFRGRYAITPRLSFGGSIELFSIETSDAGGRLSDAYLGIDYTFNDRVGVGVAYNRVSMNIDADDSSGFQGQLDWGYDGYMLYLKLDFGG
jgi:hypothetical protein